MYGVQVSHVFIDLIFYNIYCNIINILVMYNIRRIKTIFLVLSPEYKNLNYYFIYICYIYL